MKRKQRSTLVLVVFWSVVLGASGAWLWRAERQERLNRDLIVAIKREDTPAALLALERGAEANARDEQDVPGWQRIWDLFQGHRSLHSGYQTPLFLLIRRYRKEDTELLGALLAHGSRVNVIDEYAFSPIFYAVGSNKAVTVQMLFDHGADIRIDSTSNRLLVNAVSDRAAPAIIEMLIQHGADPNQMDSSGVAPLFAAIQIGNDDAVRCLLRHHADPNRMVPTNPPIRPLEYVERRIIGTGRGTVVPYFKRRMTEIAQLLRAAGAKR